MKYLIQANLLRQQIHQRLPGDEVRGSGSCCLMATESLSGMMKKFWIDNGNDGTTVNIINVTL